MESKALMSHSQAIGLSPHQGTSNMQRTGSLNCCGLLTPTCLVLVSLCRGVSMLVKHFMLVCVCVHVGVSDR